MRLVSLMFAIVPSIAMISSESSKDRAHPDDSIERHAGRASQPKDFDGKLARQKNEDEDDAETDDAGYKHGIETERAFKIYYERMNWRDAQDVCKSVGGNLVTDDSYSIHSWLTQKNMMLWIGASDAEIEGEWKWTNGNPVQAEPNQWIETDIHDHEDKDCSMLDKVIKKWTDEKCSRILSFACERYTGPGYIHNVVPGRAFKIHTSHQTWESANKTCQSEGGNLISDDRPEIHSWLKRGGRKTWIGANDQVTEGEWIWANGQPVQSTYWATNQPRKVTRSLVKMLLNLPKNQQQQDREDCVIINDGEIGKWSAVSCTDTHLFICERLTAVSGYVHGIYPGRTFKFHPELKSWEEAQKICQHDGGNLVGDDVPEIHVWLKQKGQKMWIGANDQVEEDTYVWADGRPVQGGFWALNQITPLHRDTKDCVNINDIEKGLIGLWSVASCSDTNPFVCERYVPGYIHHVVPGRAFKIHHDYKNWDDAQKTCKSEGGYLASDDEFNIHWWLHEDGRKMWIGATDKDVMDEWKWANGQPVKKTFWAENEPDAWPNGHMKVDRRNDRCAATNSLFGDRQEYIGGWTANSCSDTHLFVCERSKAVENGCPRDKFGEKTLIMCPSKKATGKYPCIEVEDLCNGLKKCEKGEDENSKHCMAFLPTIDYLKWLQRYMDGTSISNKSAISLIPDIYDLQPWLLHTDEVEETFSPAHERPSKKERQRQEASVPDSVTEPARERPVPGFVYDVVPGRAFKIHREKQNWRNAQRTCQLEGGNLVTDDDRDIHDWLSKDPVQKWIGATDKEREGRWKWTNGRDVLTTYWAEAEVGEQENTKQRRRKDCAFIHKSQEEWIGKWGDERCGKALQFVCERSLLGRMRMVNFYLESKYGGGSVGASDSWNPAVEATYLNEWGWWGTNSKMARWHYQFGKPKKIIKIRFMLSAKNGTSIEIQGVTADKRKSSLRLQTFDPESKWESIIFVIPPRKRSFFQKYIIKIKQLKSGHPARIKNITMKEDTFTDECKSKPCQNGATCTNVEPYIKETRYGDALQENRVILESMSKWGYTCECKPGFTGLTCETDINKCEDEPCMNGAKCIQGEDTYECICKHGFFGTNCDRVGYREIEFLRENELGGSAGGVGGKDASKAIAIGDIHAQWKTSEENPEWFYKFAEAKRIARIEFTINLEENLSIDVLVEAETAESDRTTIHPRSYTLRGLKGRFHTRLDIPARNRNLYRKYVIKIAKHHPRGQPEGWQQGLPVEISNVRMFEDLPTAIAISKTSYCDEGWSRWNSKKEKISDCNEYETKKYCKKDGDHYGEGWKHAVWKTFDDGWMDQMRRTALVCPFCGCNKDCCLTSDCSDYRGTKATAASGRSCTAWPRYWRGKIEENEHLRLRHGQSINYCRNPDPTHYSHAWCFTTNGLFWEYCEIPLCSDPNCVYTSGDVKFDFTHLSPAFGQESLIAHQQNDARTKNFEFFPCRGKSVSMVLRETDNTNHDEIKSTKGIGKVPQLKKIKGIDTRGLVTGYALKMSGEGGTSTIVNLLCDVDRNRIADVAKRNVSRKVFKFVKEEPALTYHFNLTAAVCPSPLPFEKSAQGDYGEVEFVGGLEGSSGALNGRLPQEIFWKEGDLTNHKTKPGWGTMRREASWNYEFASVRKITHIEFVMYSYRRVNIEIEAEAPVKPGESLHELEAERHRKPRRSLLSFTFSKTDDPNNEVVRETKNVQLEIPAGKRDYYQKYIIKISKPIKFPSLTTIYKLRMFEDLSPPPEPNCAFFKRLSGDDLPRSAAFLDFPTESNLVTVDLEPTQPHGDSKSFVRRYFPRGYDRYPIVTYFYYPCGQQPTVWKIEQLNSSSIIRKKLMGGYPQLAWVGKGDDNQGICSRNHWCGGGVDTGYAIKMRGPEDSWVFIHLLCNPAQHNLPAYFQKFYTREKTHYFSLIHRAACPQLVERRTLIDECESKPCQNGATCTNGKHWGDEMEKWSYDCICTPGFTGTNCETDIDECEANPCQNGAICINKENSYACNCRQGFSGTNCSTDECKKQCPDLRDEICASDGRTYKNRCRFEKAKCRAKRRSGKILTIKAERRCRNRKREDGSFSDDCEIGRIGCASKNATAKYPCIDDDEVCNGEPDCPNGEDEDPTVCMFKRVTLYYENIIHIDLNWRPYHTEDMAQKAEEDTCRFPGSEEQNQVCANNGHMYKNQEDFELASCINHRRVGIELRQSSLEYCQSCQDIRDGVDRRFECSSKKDGVLWCIDEDEFCDGIRQCPGGEDEDHVACMFLRALKPKLVTLVQMAKEKREERRKKDEEERKTTAKPDYEYLVFPENKDGDDDQEEKKNEEDGDDYLDTLDYLEFPENKDRDDGEEEKRNGEDGDDDASYEY